MMAANTRRLSPADATRLRTQVRIVITMFVCALLAIVALGWVWTTTHQPPALATAAHTVLTTAAVAGVFALAKIWGRI